MARKRRSQQVVEPTTPNTFMDPYENQFYLQLKQITKLQQAWDESCKWYEMNMAKKWVNHADETFKQNQERGKYLEMVKTILMNAGRILGYNPRFIVTIDKSEKLHIQPKNGSATRMMQRWDDIEAMCELGKD